MAPRRCAQAFMAPTRIPSAAYTHSSTAAGWMTRPRPIVSTPCDAMYAVGPEPRARGQDLAQLGQRLRRCELGALGAAGDGDDLGRLVQPELADAVDGSDGGRLAVAERDDEQRREQADARVWIAVGGGDRAQAILDQAHGVVTHRERGAEAEQQCPDVVCVRLQDTIRISWLVLFRRRPPSSVTVTMSSMRTPKRSGR